MVSRKPSELLNRRIAEARILPNREARQHDSVHNTVNPAEREGRKEGRRESGMEEGSLGMEMILSRLLWLYHDVHHLRANSARAILINKGERQLQDLSFNRSLDRYRPTTGAANGSVLEPFTPVFQAFSGRYNLLICPEPTTSESVCLYAGLTSRLIPGVCAT